jgi:hypothetical protein
MAALGNFHLLIVPGSSLVDPIIDDALLQFQAWEFARLIDVFGHDQPVEIHDLRRGTIESTLGEFRPSVWLTPDIVIITGVTRHQCLPYLNEGRGVYCPETSSSEDDDNDGNNDDDDDDNEDNDDDYDDDYLEDDCPE